MSVERSESATVDSANPWPGLAPFTEDQSGFFHGRDEEIRTLARLMERKALTVLFGQSGLGKSSLLQAGVFPRLRAAGFCPVYIRLDHGDGTPSPTEQVKTVVAAETARVGTWTKPGAAKPGESLWEFFHHRDDRLVDASGRTIVPVLVFDQFEELFTLGAHRDRAVAFMSELAELVENRPSERLVARLDQSTEEMDAFDFSRTDYRVCISLREDYLPHLEGLKTIMPALMENRMRLTRMTGTQALDAVLKPGGELVTPEVARTIVEFVSGARGGSAERLAELDVEPPLLSVICRELNERRRALGQAQITADLVTGNRREILHDFYERSVADLPEPMRRFVEDKLLTKSGFRDNLALETALEEPGVTKPLIDTLVQRRLLRIEDRIGTQRVELTHDVLADVVRASRDARQQRLALEQAQVREQAALVAAARRTRRLRWLVAGLAVVVVGLGTGAVFGIRAQRLAAERASRTDLTFASRLLAGDETAEGIAYAERAARTDPKNPVVAPRLLSALAARSFLLPERAPLQLPAGVAWLGYTPDGRELFVLGTDGVIRVLDSGADRVLREFTLPKKAQNWRKPVWFASANAHRFAVILADDSILVGDTASGRPLCAPIRTPGKLWTGAGLSPDGRWFAAGTTTEMFLWDATTGALRATLPFQGDSFSHAAFSPDSTRLATSIFNHSSRIWSVPDGRPLTAPLPGGTNCNRVSFSPDGRLLATATNAGVELRDTATGRRVGPLLATEDIAFFPPIFTSDGKRVIEYSRDRMVRVWDVATGRLALPPMRAGTSAGSIPVVSRDGRVLLVANGDGYTRLFDLETGQPLAEPALQQEDYPNSTLSPDGTHAVVGTTAGLIYRVPIEPGAARPLAWRSERTRYPMESDWTFRPGIPARLSWLTTGGEKRFDVTSGRETAGGFVVPPKLQARETTESGLVLLDDAAAAKGSTTEHGRFRAVIHGFVGMITDAGLHVVPLAECPTYPHYVRPSADGKRIVIVDGDSGDRKLRVWDTQSGLPVSPVMVAEDTIFYTAAGSFSPDNKRLATGSANGGARIWDATTGKVVFDLKPLPDNRPTFFVLYSPDGSHIATSSLDESRLWDAATGRPTSPVLHHKASPQAAAFSPDGRYYAVGLSSGVARVWTVRDGTPVGQPLVYEGGITALAFNADGTRIVTGSSDKTARVWDTRTGLPLTEPLTHAAAVNFVQFSPDGRFVLTTTAQGATVWAVPPDAHGAAAPDWLLRLATMSVGKRVTDDGQVENAADDLAHIDDLRRALAALPDDAPYVEWGRWFLAERATRPIAPGFTITPAEADKLAKESATPAAAAAPPTATAAH